MLVSDEKKNKKLQKKSPIKGHVLEVQVSTRYLGVDLQSKMSWKTNIGRVTKKANSTLGFQGRNLKAAIEDTKASAYFCLVRSNLEYCCPVCMESPVKRGNRESGDGTINE